jgi:simple sugar transport system ATP-binding protein
MVGREVKLAADRPLAPDGEARVRLEARELSVARADGGRAVDGLSLAVREREIVGVAGVEGNGQSALALALTGVVAAERGAVLLDGQEVTALPVRERQRRGLGHVPEDRLQRGLIGAFSVEDNLLLGRDDEYARAFGFAIDRARLRSDADALIARLNVQTPDAAAPVGTLSGGNQQKVVVGRELGRRPTALVCAQPTRGVDVGAIELIHAELLGARDAGCAVLLISAELDELLALADRILVMRSGRVVGEVANPPGGGPEARVERKAALGRLMLGAA